MLTKRTIVGNINLNTVKVENSLDIPLMIKTKCI